MAEENEQLTPMERISRQEFELDADEQAAIIEETEQALKQVNISTDFAYLFSPTRVTPTVSLHSSCVDCE